MAELAARPREYLGNVETNLGNSKSYLLRALQDLEDLGDHASARQSARNQITNDKKAAQATNVSTLQNQIFELEVSLAAAKSDAVRNLQAIKDQIHAEKKETSVDANAATATQAKLQELCGKQQGELKQLQRNYEAIQSQLREKEAHIQDSIRNAAQKSVHDNIGDELVQCQRMLDDSQKQNGTLRSRICDLEEAIQLLRTDLNSKNETLSKLRVSPPDDEAENLAREAADWDAYTPASDDATAQVMSDLSEWLNQVVPGARTAADTLLRDLASGVVLCNLAEQIDVAEGAYRKTEQGTADDKAAARRQKEETQRLRAQQLPRPRRASKKDVMSAYKPHQAATLRGKFIRKRQLRTKLGHVRNCVNGSSAARGNVELFVEWGAGLGLVQPLVFAIDDLCRYRDEGAVLRGLLDVARCARGMPLPLMVQFERKHYLPLHYDKDALDYGVRRVLRDMVCGIDVEKLGNGNYYLHAFPPLARPSVLLLERGTKIVVRRGGGFEDLTTYLENVDPWRSNPAIKARLAQWRATQEELRTALREGAVNVDGSHPGIRSNRPEQSIIVAPTREM
eukprot:m.483300 g.483300  ORF g.483300 m.483300 type:complete len:567 (-) comp21726_c0_seq1:1718-3418(-)